MLNKLEAEVLEYIESRLKAVKKSMVTECEDLLPVEVTPAKLGEWLKDVDTEKLNWQQAERYFCLGADDKCWWIKRNVKLPAEKSGWSLGLNFDLGVQTGVGHGALLYLNGVEYESFTPVMQHMFSGHEIVILPEKESGKEAEFLLKCYSGRDHGPEQKTVPKLLNTMRLVWLNKDAASLYFRGMVILRLLGSMEDTSGTYRALAGSLKESLKLIDFSDPTEKRKYSTITQALNSLEKELAKLKSENDIDLLTLVGIGHAHIDTAWTWPYIVSREKMSQTVTTALGLIDKYPEYIFHQGQPQLYEFLKDDSPALYSRVKKAVADGRWDAEGGMWVEPDCNIPSGEGLVRQLLYGKRFFREEFGVESKVLWLVDTFGFPQTLPQIAKGCGIDYFVTTKISWNRYNRMPYSFFNWKGPDGTKLPTYFMTLPWETTTTGYDTYNAVPDPAVIKLGFERRYPKESSRELLNSLGWGDGGGGATFEMIEWMRVLSDGIAGRISGRWEKTRSFLDKQIKECGFDIPVWNDELFLEFHRGTLTTHAELKKLNRRSETTLQQAEMLNVLAGSSKYPSEEFRNLWKKVLINQFHDVMAGSSTHDVFEEARDIYKGVIAEAEKLISSGGEKLLGDNDKYVAVFNTLSHERKVTENVALPEGKVLENESGSSRPMQRVDKENAIVDLGTLPAVGYKRFKVVDGKAEVKGSAIVKDNVLENDFVRIEFDLTTGLIASIFDKQAGREILDGFGNKIQFFEDKPFDQNISAWEIDRIYQEKPFTGLTELVSIEPFGDSLRRGMKVEQKFQGSVISQEIYLESNSPVIFFRTRVDWHENETMMKAAFPVRINASQACFDIQFGHIYRPTHNNTLIDIAKFEVPHQKWMDVSEGDYGVSILNDSKYGCDIKENVMRLTLLRSPIQPDPLADRGIQEFVYAVYPHAGGWQQAKTVQYAKELNEKVLVLSADTDAPAEASFIQVAPSNLILETVKKAEDEDAIVVRLYESANIRGTGKITFNLPDGEIKKAMLCDMEERDIRELTVSDGAINIEFLPCEVLSLKVVINR